MMAHIEVSSLHSKAANQTLYVSVMKNATKNILENHIERGKQGNLLFKTQAAALLKPFEASMGNIEKVEEHSITNVL